MVNWTKHVEKAAKGLLRPNEKVLAGVKLTQDQFHVTGGATTGGLVAGGAVGAVVGAAWDKKLDAKHAAATAAQPATAGSDLPARSIEFPRTGAIAGVTNHRLLFFRASEFGKPKELFYEVETATIAALHERDFEKKLLQGTPPSRQVTIHFSDETTLTVWGLTGPGNAKWLNAYTAAIRASAHIA